MLIIIISCCESHDINRVHGCGRGHDCVRGLCHDRNCVNGRHARDHEHGLLHAVQATLSNPKGRRKPGEQTANMQQLMSASRKKVIVQNIHICE